MIVHIRNKGNMGATIHMYFCLKKRLKFLHQAMLKNGATREGDITGVLPPGRHAIYTIIIPVILCHKTVTARQ